MELIYIENGSIQEFSLIGKLDYDSYTKFDEFIQFNYKKDLDVLLNLEKLTYISSVGLRSFIKLAKLVRADKKEIKIKAEEDGMVKKIIVLTGFAKLMPFV